MQKEVGIPQKERKSISKFLFGENGIVTADSSFSFDKKSAVVFKVVSKFPKFAEYFRKRLKPTIENYVNTACRKAPYSQLWTNNNYESLNHIIKMAADWKSAKTAELISMLHNITLLHFKAQRRSLYGTGNYRLSGTFKIYFVSREYWHTLGEGGKAQIFKDFLKHKKKVFEHENGK